jgi:predicted DNA-binding transcriptional regulator YafY
MPVDEDHFRTVVNVAVSNQFLGWIMAIGSDVRITAPESVVEKMRDEIKRLSEQYK